MNDEDESELARLLPDVKRLRSDRINPYQQRKPLQQQRKIQPQRNQSSSPSTYTYSPTSAKDSQFNNGLQLKIQRKIRQGKIRPESTIDLHGYRQHEALTALEDMLADAQQRHHRMLLIIHGQGFRSSSEAVLKPLVQRWLSEQPQVLAWCPAQIHDGGGGASYAYLRS